MMMYKILSYRKYYRPYRRLSALLGVSFGACVMLLCTAKANTIYQYQDSSRGGQLFLTNVQQSGKGFVQRGVTYYPDTKLHGTHDVPQTYNPETASTPSRSANKNSYDALIINAGVRYGIDPALIKAIIHTESNFKANAKSPVGAMGLMQLMPGTARDMGVVNAWDPAQNIEGGVKYLAFLFKKFSNIDHVIAAYNAGFGNVNKYGGIPPFKETKNYVRSVKNRYTTLYQTQGILPSAISAPIQPSLSQATGGRIYISR